MSLKDRLLRLPIGREVPFVQIGLKIGLTDIDLEKKLEDLLKSDPSIGYLDSRRGIFIRGGSSSKRVPGNDKLEEITGKLAQAIENWKRVRDTGNCVELKPIESDLVAEIQGFIEEIRKAGGLQSGGKIDEFDEKSFLPIERKKLDPIFQTIASEDFSKFRSNFDENTWFSAGYIAHAFSLLQAAKIFYETSLLLKPNFAEARSNLGYVYIENKSWEDARDAFEEVLNQKMTYEEAWRGLGIVRRKLSDLPGAVDAFRKTLNINPKNAKAWCELGFTLRAQGEVTEVLQSYEKALKLDLNSAESWERVGIAMKKFGWDEQALYCWERAMELGHTLWGKWIGQLRKRGVKPKIPDFLDKY